MAIHTLAWQQMPPAACRGGAVAIGNFDGVHRGHGALLAELRKQAQHCRGPAAALTFDPHPLQLLRPEHFKPTLTTLSDRASLLLDQGVDCVLILKTEPDLLHLTAEEFFEQVVRRRLAAKAMVEGTNFGFGRNREGTVETLAQLCQRDGLRLVVVPPLQIDEVAVSSSRVRDALLRGDVQAAANLLGRPYHLSGTVGGGQRRGQSLGFPTANLEQVATQVPADGVYAVRVLLGKTTYSGAANIGPNPTFGEQARKIEVHLIDFQGYLYGQTLSVHFIARLRDTRPFASVAGLVEQLRQDVEQARRLTKPTG